MHPVKTSDCNQRITSASALTDKKKANRRVDLWRSAALLLAVILAGVAVPTATAQGQTFADTIIFGNLITMETGQPRAQAMAIRGDRILAIGSVESVKAWQGPQTKNVVIDGDRVILPGLIEGHAHYLGLGHSLMMLRLADAETWDEIVERVAEAAKVTPPGQWIIGRGWHQSKWSEAPKPNVQGYPTTELLDELTPNHPVLLTHASGHMSFANGYAMRLAGIDETTQPPSGGEILRDGNGKAIGVFRETAQGLISRVHSRDEAKQSDTRKAELFAEAVALAGQECLKHGITSFQDAGTSVADLRRLKLMAVNGQLPVRLWMMIRDDNELLATMLPTMKAIGMGNDFFTCRALKRSIDGALGPHGAWLLAPYSDLPTSTGLNTASIESVERTAELAIAHDFQLCVHAIGDRANQETLNIFERALNANKSTQPRRWRIEHAQHLAVEDIPRFGQLGVIASMQGIHCTSDAIFVLQRLGGMRAEQGAYVWRDLLASGAIVTNGSDAPVENINPFASLAATITRQLPDGQYFFPEQAMTREEALRSYTIDCAYSAFEENLKGSLVPGKLADFIIVDKDPLECPVEEIATIQVDATYVGGNLVYQKNTDEK